MLTDTVLSINFSDIFGAFLDIFRQMTILQIVIFGSASVLIFFGKVQEINERKRRNREREEYRRRREDYQRRKLDYEEKRLDALEKGELRSRQYQKMKEERQRLSAELRSLRATIRNERLSGCWDVLGY